MTFGLDLYIIYDLDHISRNYTMIFGEKFAKRRKKLGISAQVLAKQVGVSRSYVTLIENGKRLPSKRYFPTIVTALAITKTTLITWYLADIKEKITQ